jgi:hypothetical protein
VLTNTGWLNDMAEEERVLKLGKIKRGLMFFF